MEQKVVALSDCDAIEVCCWLFGVFSIRVLIERGKER